MPYNGADLEINNNDNDDDNGNDNDNDNDNDTYQHRQSKTEVKQWKRMKENNRSHTCINVVIDVVK